VGKENARHASGAFSDPRNSLSTRSDSARSTLADCLSTGSGPGLWAMLVCRGPSGSDPSGRSHDLFLHLAVFEDSRVECRAHRNAWVWQSCGQQSILPTLTLPWYSLASPRTQWARWRRARAAPGGPEIDQHGLSDFNTSASKFASVTSTIPLAAIVPPRYSFARFLTCGRGTGNECFRIVADLKYYTCY